MNEPIITVVDVGKYKFQIIDNTSISSEGKIYSRNFKIGGKHVDCVNISIDYSDNIPISAKIPHAMYDEECTLNIPLERGGSVIMIKTLLQHVHKQIPTITEVEFEDKSNIECATENEIITKGSRFRKRGTNVTPIPLYYFSIAFNGKTWYEKYFNARLKDPNKYEIYRENVKQLLYSHEFKTETTFIRFLEIAKPPKQVADKLEKYYNESDTFGIFFQSIPKSERCNLIRDWIYKFMAYHLKEAFSNADWIIEFQNGKSVRDETKRNEVSSSVDFTDRKSVTSTDDRGLYVTKGDVKPTDQPTLAKQDIIITTEPTKGLSVPKKKSSIDVTDIREVKSMDDEIYKNETVKKGGNKRKTRKYYCPKGRIRYYTAGYSLGVDQGDL